MNSTELFQNPIERLLRSFNEKGAVRTFTTLLKFIGMVIGGYVLDLQTKFLVHRVRTRCLGKEKEYLDYVSVQIRKSFNISKTRAGDRPLDRTVYLTRKMQPWLPANATILCIGCRDEREIDHIERECRATARGLDLFSRDPRIVVGDMHQIPFPDDSFDAVYSCHSLEHSFDFNKALSEFVRVAKPTGLVVLEVPTNFQICATDRWDFKTTQKLASHLGPAMDRVLFEESSERELRLIARLSKAS